MKTYVRMEFSSEGASPTDVIKKMEGLGFTLVMGDYDFQFTHKSSKEFFELLDKMHGALKGTNIRYMLTTKGF